MEVGVVNQSGPIKKILRPQVVRVQSQCKSHFKEKSALEEEVFRYTINFFFKLEEREKEGG